MRLPKRLNLAKSNPANLCGGCVCSPRFCIRKVGFVSVMRKERHLLTGINPEEKTGVCCIDGLVSITPTGTYKEDGSIYWRCAPQKNWLSHVSKRPYIVHKKSQCELCGFVPENPVQLDVDHVDGNNANNNPDNLQTLCANCHRLKTHQNKDWLPTVLPDITE